MQPMSTAEHARHDARIYTAREVAVAFAAVLALHAALVLWLLREGPARIEPHEATRTIVARLLSAPPTPAVTIAPRAAPPLPTRTSPPRPTPETSRKIAAQQQPAQQQKTPARHEEAIASAPALATSPTPAPPTAAPPTAEPAAPPQAMRAPKPVSHVDCRIAQPDYPEAARRRGEAGTAVVRFVVGVDGRVESAQILRSSGYARLDNAALDALQSSTCHPWLDGGVPVRVVFEQPFVFGLDN
jgi:periplasmic protein TonB